MRASQVMVAAALSLAFQGPALAQDRTAQARLNYEAVLNGGRQIGDLSAQELADVIEFNRRLRQISPDTRTPSQRCIDAEVKKADGPISDLTRRAITMKCREAG